MGKWLDSHVPLSIYRPHLSSSSQRVPTLLCSCFPHSRTLKGYLRDFLLFSSCSNLFAASISCSYTVAKLTQVNLEDLYKIMAVNAYLRHDLGVTWIIANTPNWKTIVLPPKQYLTIGTYQSGFTNDGRRIPVEPSYEVDWHQPAEPWRPYIPVTDEAGLGGVARWLYGGKEDLETLAVVEGEENVFCVDGEVWSAMRRASRLVRLALEEVVRKTSYSGTHPSPPRDLDLDDVFRGTEKNVLTSLWNQRRHCLDALGFLSYVSHALDLKDYNPYLLEDSAALELVRHACTLPKRGVAVRLSEFQTASGGPIKGFKKEWGRWLKDKIPVAVVWCREIAEDPAYGFVTDRGEDFYLRVDNPSERAPRTLWLAPRYHDHLAYPISLQDAEILEDSVRFEIYENLYEKVNLKVYFLDCPLRAPKPRRVIQRNPFGDLDDELDYGDHSSDIEPPALPRVEGRTDHFRFRRLRQFVNPDTLMTRQMEAAGLLALFPPETDPSDESFDLNDREERDRREYEYSLPSQTRRRIYDDYDPEPSFEDYEEYWEYEQRSRSSDCSMDGGHSSQSDSDMRSVEGTGAPEIVPEGTKEGPRRPLWERLGLAEDRRAGEKEESRARADGHTTPTGGSPAQWWEEWKTSLSDDEARLEAATLFEGEEVPANETFLNDCHLAFPPSSKAWLLELIIANPYVTKSEICTKALKGGIAFRVGIPPSYEQSYAGARREELREAKALPRTTPFWTNETWSCLLDPPLRLVSDLQPFLPPQIAVNNSNTLIGAQYRRNLDRARYDPRLPLMLLYGGELARIAYQIGPRDMVLRLLTNPSDCWVAYQAKAEVDGKYIYETYANPADDPLAATLLGQFEYLQQRSFWPPVELFYGDLKWTGRWSEANETWFTSIWDKITAKTAVAQSYTK